MSEVTITIDGKAYPYRQTMGAMLRFKKETGREVSEMENTMEDICRLLYCCVAATAGASFSMTFEEFVDGLEIEDFLAFSRGLERATSKGGAAAKK